LKFYHGDHLGSSTLVVEVENVNNTPTPTVIHRQDYTAYGKDIVPSSTFPFTPKNQFNGKEKDEVSGFYDYSARMYNPATGRFLSPDSVLTEARYAYADNNPLKNVDPTGHQDKPADTAPPGAPPLSFLDQVSLYTMALEGVTLPGGKDSGDYFFDHRISFPARLVASLLEANYEQRGFSSSNRGTKRSGLSRVAGEPESVPVVPRIRKNTSRVTWAADETGTPVKVRVRTAANGKTVMFVGGNITPGIMNGAFAVASAQEIDVIAGHGTRWTLGGLQSTELVKAVGPTAGLHYCFFSCSTGSGGDVNVASFFSREAGVTVTAPTNDLWIDGPSHWVGSNEKALRKPWGAPGTLRTFSQSQ
jgi:RHS repeat-associated protein